MAAPANFEARTPQQRILQRKSALWNDRSSWDPHCQEIADYLLPRAARISAQDVNRGGASNFNSILDESATLAHGYLSAGLMSNMTSPARPWLRLVTPDKELTEYGPVKTWHAKVTAKMLAIFRASNTYDSLHCLWDQIGAFGVGASVIVEHYDNVLHHYPQTYGSYAIGLDQWGYPDTLYREMTKSVAQVVDTFGAENCSMTVRNLYDRGQYDATVQVIHAIEPRRDRQHSQLDARNMAWSSCYIEAGRDGERQYLRESGFTEFPAICGRWVVDGDDTYSSRWPAATALGSIKQLQQEQLRKSTAIDYMVDPPLQVPVAYRNQDVDRLPGGLMYVDMASPTGGIRSAFEVNLDLQHLLADIQDVRQRIDRAFYVDLFRMLAQDTRSGTTAYEMAIRHEEKLMMLGPIAERLHNEMLAPLVENTFSRMVRAGMMRPGMELEPPKELQGQALEIEFISTLAQAQRAVGVQSIDRLIGTMGSVANIKPEVLDKLDADQLVDAYADMLGVDPSLIVADKQVAMIRQDRAKAAQAQQVAAMAPAMKDMAQAGQAASNIDPTALAGLFQGYSIPGVA